MYFMVRGLNISRTTTARIKKMTVYVKNHLINSGSHQVSLVVDRSEGPKRQRTQTPSLSFGSF